MSRQDSKLRIGLERLLSDQQHILNGRRFSVVMNRASVNADVRLACDLLAEKFPGQLRSILSPQHGLWCEQQANMIETAHGRHDRLCVPVYSLYSQTRRPTEEMLSGIDCLVIDLQDAGTRVYTFIWTMLYCLHECASRQISVVVLDRPNPIGGMISEGPLLDLACRSFVGEAEIPMRHGMTIGELAGFFNKRYGINAELVVVPMEGWRRDQYFDETGRLWVPPSPNMQAIQTAVVYPGQVLLEGTNLSEGRGTTVPFEVIGAPFIEPGEFCEHLQSLGLQGVRFLPIRFTPTFDKWAALSCGGVSIHVTDRAVFRSYEMTVRILKLCREKYPDECLLNPPPYEYENSLMPLDIISGSSLLRECIGRYSEIEAAIALDCEAWDQERSEFLLYPRVI
ncbi:MAG: DUF1343 domain-containing protein [Planctomycetota bacterium]|nr:MAG: DUF1343 domain-containing protein [Planctomycetota bacterium]